MMNQESELNNIIIEHDGDIYGVRYCIKFENGPMLNTHEIINLTNPKFFHSDIHDIISDAIFEKECEAIFA